MSPLFPWKFVVHTSFEVENFRKILLSTNFSALFADFPRTSSYVSIDNYYFYSTEG